LRQKSTGLLFQLIPSGEFVMGLTEKEEGAARRIRDPIPVDIREMRPAVKMEVEAFLMTSAPITSRVFRRFASEAPTGVQFTDEPVFVSFDQAMRFATSIDCSLPQEVQWEYACRAMTETLFVWGDHLPVDQELEKWLSLDFKEGYQTLLNSNRFGLYGLFTGEWCRDEYRIRHDPAAPCLVGEHVVRGGGAMFWPWQDHEWVHCMSARRMPESGLFADRQAGFRLVRELTS